tara:strand:+ start:204 stop:854 length:651 start_codon:yes stop_codon:yes gene_type:complete
MNLLGNPGIQNNLDSIIKENPKIVKEQKKIPKNQFSKKNKKYFNSIILVSFFLILFFSYSFYISSKNNYTKNIFNCLSLFQEHMNNIISFEMIDNNMRLVLDYEWSDQIYIDYDLYYSKYSFVGFLVDSKSSQIIIKDSFKGNKNIDFYELFNSINYVDNINIEKEIVEDNLIIIGNNFEITKIFDIVKKYNFNFKLQLIKKIKNKNYYNLVIYND